VLPTTVWVVELFDDPIFLPGLVGIVATEAEAEDFLAEMQQEAPYEEFRYREVPTGRKIEPG
jgi:hypothetical protein